MVAPFPLVKLGALAVRQVSKPLANYIKSRAKSSPFFRTWVCMPPAQMYHWIEVNVKMKLLNLGKPREVQPLTEAAAVELGAELLGEFVIFCVAASTLTAEYIRQSRKASAEASALEERWNGVESRIEELEYLVNKQNAEIRELTRVTYSVDSSLKSILSGDKNGTDSNHRDSSIVAIKKGVITKAIEDAQDKMSGKKQT
jgi:hypothetical protein